MFAAMLCRARVLRVTAALWATLGILAPAQGSLERRGGSLGVGERLGDHSHPGPSSRESGKKGQVLDGLGGNRGLGLAQNLSGDCLISCMSLVMTRGVNSWSASRFQLTST